MPILIQLMSLQCPVMNQDTIPPILKHVSFGKALKFLKLGSDLFSLWFSLFFCSVDAWTLAFSPDSQYLATGTHVGEVNLFGVESGEKEYSLDTRGKFILSIAYVRKYCFVSV